MLSYNNILILAVFIPLIGAFALPLLGRLSKGLRNWFALSFVVASFVCSLVLAHQAFTGKPVIFAIPLIPACNFVFQADGLAVFMALASSFISAIIVLYSFGYISHYEHQSEYYCMAVLFLGAMIGLVYAANLILLYIFWEITAITSWRLIGFFREKTYVLKADKAFLVTVFGALVMLIGFISIFQQTGSFDMAAIKNASQLVPISNLAVLLILVGIFSKSATLPFHTWLPDAGVAPSPVTALLHAAVLVKIGVYVYARLFIATFPIAEIWHTVVPIVAITSAIVSAGAALIETDIKRIIAYSTISQIGFIFFAFSVNNEIGASAGLLYILMHGLAKGGLFLCAGIIEQNTKIKDITKMGGLIKTMPLTAVSFLFCAFSVMGIPPFGGFFSKYLVFSGAINSRQFLMSGLFLTGAFLTIIYLFRLFNMIFLAEPKQEPAREGSAVMVGSVLALGALSLLAGIFINYPYMFSQQAAMQMTMVLK